MKAIGKEILRSKGFTDNEIFVEFPVIEAGQVLERERYDAPNIKVIVRKGIVADVVGLTKERSMVVECGNTPSDRLSQLKLFFDEVLYLPYVKTLGRPEKDILELNQQITSLTKENTRLRLENEAYKDRLENLERKITDALRGR